MKTSFLRILPLTAAVLLATSCSKDENNDQEVVNNSPENVVIEKSVVKIPFSVKVNQGKTLSKIAYSGSESAVTVSFTEDDVNNGTTLTVTGTGIETSILTLEKQGDSYIFKGDINLSSDEYRESFESGNIDLTGSFGNVETEIKSSTVSLADLMENCNHQYLATFKSNAASIDLYDQNSYIAFTVADGQYKVNIGDNWYPQGDAKIDQNLNKLWVVLPAGNVSGHFIKAGSTVEAGKIYTITRTDVVDLGVGNVLWCTSNATDQQMNYSTALSSYGTADENGYRLPTQGEYEALKAVTPTGGWTTENSIKGWKFTNDYGSVFFPATGYNDGYEAGVYGYYWSSSPERGDGAYSLYFLNGGAYVGPQVGLNKYSVRLVRGL